MVINLCRMTQERRKQIVDLTTYFEALQREALLLHLTEQKTRYKAIKEIKGLYTFVLYDFVKDLYYIKHIPLIVKDNESINDTFIMLCKLTYNVGFPIVFSVMSFESEIEDTVLGLKHTGLMMFTETPLLSKFAFYHVRNDDFEIDTELTRRMRVIPPNIFNLGAIISQTPQMN